MTKQGTRFDDLTQDEVRRLRRELNAKVRMRWLKSHTNMMMTPDEDLEREIQVLTSILILREMERRK